MSEDDELITRESLLSLDPETIENIIESLGEMDPDAEAILVGEEEEIIRVGMRIDADGPLITMSAKALLAWLKDQHAGFAREIPLGQEPQRVLPEEMFSGFSIEPLEEEKAPLTDSSLIGTMINSLLSVGVGIYLDPALKFATLHDIGIVGELKLELWSDEHHQYDVIETKKGFRLMWEPPHYFARQAGLSIYEIDSTRIFASAYHGMWSSDEEPGSPSYEHLRIQAA